MVLKVLILYIDKNIFEIVKKKLIDNKEYRFSLEWGILINIYKKKKKEQYEIIFRMQMCVCIHTLIKNLLYSVKI